MNRKIFSLLIAFVLGTSLLLAACAPAPPEAEEVAELEAELAAEKAKTSDLEGEVADLEKEIAALRKAAPAPVEPEYKIVFAAPTLEPNTVRSHKLFVELVNHRSEGRIEMTYYGDAVLGTEDAVFTDVSAGAVEITHIATGQLVRWVPWASVATDLPFAWTSWLDCFRWHEQVWIPEINKELAPHNLMMLPYVGSEGASGIFSRVGPIHSPADAEGKIFRAYSPGIEVAWMEALGAKATVLPWAELFTALETGVIDLMHNPLGFCMELGFAEVTGDFTETNHKIWTDGLLVSLEWWNTLPEDVQILIDEAWFDAATLFKWVNWDVHAFWLEEAQKSPYNMNIYRPTAEELAQFKAAMAPVYDWARQEYGDDKVDMMLKYAK